MSGRVEPAEVVERYRRWLASVPLAERSKREYARNVEAFCGWLAEVDSEGWGGDPLADPLARDYAAPRFQAVLEGRAGVAAGVGEPGVGVAGFAVSVSGAGLAERAA